MESAESVQMRASHKEEKVYLIKRHANRQLYDTETATHISLKEIALLVIHGKNILVLDEPRSQKDITACVLAQALALFVRAHPDSLKGAGVALLEELICTAWVNAATQS